MARYLILKLDGVMQGWGGHTYEDWRPSELFPTRSGLLGLIGACLGIERDDIDKLNMLAKSIQFTIRADYRIVDQNKKIASIRLCDYHTIENARKVDGKANENPVQSYRWYLFDAIFTIAIEELSSAPISLDYIATKLRAPVYTPFLGRRSCPLSRPLLDPVNSPCGIPFIADSPLNALQKSGAGGELIYSETKISEHGSKFRMRDVPIYGRVRRFATREVHLHIVKEGENVS